MQANEPVPTELAASYASQGFFLPVDVIDDAEVRRLRADLESAEREVAGDPERRSMLRQYPHLLLPAIDELMHAPTLIDAAGELLGPDLLVWSCGLFIKEARSASVVTWHQDLTYWGLDDAREVTAWVALSPSTDDSGAMRYVPGSHRQSIVAHVDTFAEDNMLSRGQEIAVEVDESQAVSVLLEPGQASFHHGRLFHASGPNRSGDRRIGIAIRYIDPAMCQVEGQRPLARLVAGEDRHGHFSLCDGPHGRLDERDFERCRADSALRNTVLMKGVPA